MLGIQKQREFLNFNILPITHGHLRKNHTLKIILHQYETQVTNHEQKHGPQPQIKHSEQKMQSSQNVQQAHISIYSSFNCNLQKYIFQAWPLHTHTPSPKPPNPQINYVLCRLKWGEKIYAITNTHLINCYSTQSCMFWSGFICTQQALNTGTCIDRLW